MPSQQIRASEKDTRESVITSAELPHPFPNVARAGRRRGRLARIANNLSVPSTLAFGMYSDGAHQQ